MPHVFLSFMVCIFCLFNKYLFIANSVPGGVLGSINEKIDQESCLNKVGRGGGGGSGGWMETEKNNVYNK